MAWLKIDCVLARHRKTEELALDLKLSPINTAAHLIALWSAALEQAEDGDLSKWSPAFIAKSAAYTGDPQRFVELLGKHGWLDGRLVHDWPDHAGPFLAARYKNRNQDRLRQIWAKHGRVYGQEGAAPEQGGCKNGAGPEPHPTHSLDALDRRNGLDGPKPQVGPLKAFLASYPAHRLGHRMAVENTWTGLRLSEDEARTVLAALEAWKQSDEWTEDGGKYVPKAEKFLLERLWENAPTPKPQAVDIIAARATATRQRLEARRAG